MKQINALYEYDAMGIKSLPKIQETTKSQTTELKATKLPVDKIMVDIERQVQKVESEQPILTYCTPTKFKECGTKTEYNTQTVEAQTYDEHTVNKMLKKEAAITKEHKNPNDIEETRQLLRRTITGALFSQCKGDLYRSSFNFDETYNSLTKFPYENFVQQVCEIWNSAPPRPMAGYDHPTQKMRGLRVATELMVKRENEDLITSLQDQTTFAFEQIDENLKQLELALINDVGELYIIERCNAISGHEFINIRDGLSKDLMQAPIVKPLYCPSELRRYNPQKTKQQVTDDIDRLKSYYLDLHVVFVNERLDLANNAFSKALNLI